MDRVPYTQDLINHYALCLGSTERVINLKDIVNYNGFSVH